MTPLTAVLAFGAFLEIPAPPQAHRGEGEPDPDCQCGHGFNPACPVCADDPAAFVGTGNATQAPRKEGAERHPDMTLDELMSKTPAAVAEYFIPSDVHEHVGCTRRSYTATQPPRQKQLAQLLSRLIEKPSPTSGEVGEVDVGAAAAKVYSAMADWERKSNRDPDMSVDAQGAGDDLMVAARNAVHALQRLQPVRKELRRERELRVSFERECSELRAEAARLKAEVERLQEERDKDTRHIADAIRREVVLRDERDRLTAEVERLKKGCVERYDRIVELEELLTEAAPYIGYLLPGADELRNRIFAALNREA